MPPSSVQCAMAIAKAIEFAFEEDRFDDGNVGGVGIAHERIVADEDIAGADGIAVLALDGLNLGRKGAGEDRYAVGLGDQMSVGIADTAREVEDLDRSPESMLARARTTPISSEVAESCRG